MTICYRAGGCGPFEMYSCNECPASKPEYLKNNKEDKKPQKIYIPFGDWSDDGHGKYEKVLIEIEDTAALGKSVQNIKRNMVKIFSMILQMIMVLPVFHQPSSKFWKRTILILSRLEKQKTCQMIAVSKRIGMII